MEAVYFFLLIFCGIYGALRLASLFYCGLIDKLSSRIKNAAGKKMKPIKRKV